MKLDDIDVNNNKFLINTLKLYINENSHYKTIIIIGDKYNEYLKIINNTDDSIKLITDIYKLKITDFNSKLIIGINNDKELYEYYNICINKKAYKIVNKIEEGLKLYIQ